MSKLPKQAMSFAKVEAHAYPIDDATRAAILEGLAQAERQEYVAEEIVAAADRRHGI
jgi:hypothetical protein